MMEPISVQEPSRPVLPQRVMVVGFDMPFSSLVGLMIKVAASIPAAIILALTGAVVVGVLSGIVGAL